MDSYHDISPEASLRQLHATSEGLTGEDAAKRLQVYGANELKDAKGISALAIFLRQFKSFLVWILLIATAMSAFIGDIAESIVIVSILVINAVIGFAQEYRAEKAIEALKKLAGAKADVLRDGQRIQIDAKQLVPGDVVFIETGDKIAADYRLLEASNLEVQESSLTGESTPVKKSIEPVKKDAAIADRSCMAFSGTTITRGRAKALVTATGMQTEIGRIARLIEETVQELTPLQKRLDKFGKQIGIVTIAIASVIFAITVFKGGNVLEMLETAVSLAVAAVPEGLPAVVALSLAIGVQRMIKRNALIRKLPSVETLGSTTVIATDKTGTLTLDKMTVRRIYVSGKTTEIGGESAEEKLLAGDDEKLLLRIGALCNDSALTKGSSVGDPTETALLVSAAKAGLRKEELDARFRRIDEIPFDSERKRMATIHQVGDKKIMYVKGAVDVMLKLCDRVQKNGKAVKLSADECRRIEQVNESFASEALRVLGFAYKVVSGKDKSEKNLIFVGLQAMIDPPRPEAKLAIEKCRQAGIRVIMITGDHKSTASAIAKYLGIEGRAVTGEELDRIKNLEECVGDIGVYARVNPEHKIRIISALKKLKHIAAMTGDGVNDAPALKKADIGIAMGITGTDVAKEASNMILTDDNFASIVNAVEEGRGVYENIKKFIYSLISTNMAEVLIVFVAILLGLKLPLLAIQLLWINLLTDGLPAIALGLEPISKSVMAKKPRKPGEGILTKAMVIRLLVNGAFVTAGTLGFYIWALYKAGWAWGMELSNDSPIYIYALTVTFTALVFFEMFTAITAKSSDKNIFQIPLLNNKFLLFSIGLSLFLILAVVYTPLNAYFKTTPLELKDLAIILAVTSSLFLVDMVQKFFANRAATD